MQAVPCDLVKVSKALLPKGNTIASLPLAASERQAGEAAEAVLLGGEAATTCLHTRPSHLPSGNDGRRRAL